MELKKIKKIGKSKYKLYFDNKEIELFEDVIIKYNLLYKKNIDSTLLNQIIKYNSFYEIYNTALKFISIKMRNKKEIIDYLEKKMYDSKSINEVIKKLEKENYLNEENYVKAYINDKINLTNYGPYKIKSELLKYDINEFIIDNYLNNIDKDIWFIKIKKIIDRKIRLNNKLSKFYFIQKTSLDLYNLGFDKDMINDYLEDININEESAIKKEYNKAIKKFNNKYKGDLLNKYIRDYLIKKGFSYESIDNILLN